MKYKYEVHGLVFEIAEVMEERFVGWTRDYTEGQKYNVIFHNREVPTYYVKYISGGNFHLVSATHLVDYKRLFDFPISAIENLNDLAILVAKAQSGELLNKVKELLIKDVELIIDYYRDREKITYNWWQSN